MKPVLICLVLAVTTAQAGLIVSTTSTDLRAYGFGVAPPILTLQRTVLESGCSVPTDDFSNHLLGYSGATVPTGYTDLPGSYVPDVSTKYSTPALASLGVTSFANLTILFNANETGSGLPVTLQNLTLTVYDGASVVRSFSLTDPDGSGRTDFMAPAQGQGSAGFVIKISATELSSTWYPFDGGYRVGLAAQIGCTLKSGCDSRFQYGTDGGAESFTVASVEGGLPQADLPRAHRRHFGANLLIVRWLQFVCGNGLLSTTYFSGR